MLHLFDEVKVRHRHRQHREVRVHCLEENVWDEHTHPLFNDRIVPLLSVFSQDPRCIIEIVMEVLCERKIILVSSSLALLSRCIQGILGLLYPFKYFHDVIPMVPASMHHLFFAPTSYVYGIDPSRLSTIQAKAVQALSAGEELLVVDLDRRSTTKFGGQQSTNSSGLCGTLSQVSREKTSMVARESLKVSFNRAKKASKNAPARFEAFRKNSGDGPVYSPEMPQHPKALEIALVSEIEVIFSRSFGSEIKKGLLKKGSSVMGKITGTALQHASLDISEAQCFQQDDFKPVSLQQAQAVRMSFLRFFLLLFGNTGAFLSAEWAFEPEKVQRYIHSRCSAAMPQELTKELSSSATDWLPRNLQHFCSNTTTFVQFGLSAARFAKSSWMQSGESSSVCTSCTFLQIAHRLGEGAVSSQNTVAAEVKRLVSSCETNGSDAEISSGSSMTAPMVRRLVMEMTSNSKRRHVLQTYEKISEASFDSQHVPTIMKTLSWRLQESQGINWRHASKAFELLWYLICYGCDWVVSHAMAQCRDKCLVRNLIRYKSDLAGREAVRLVRHAAEMNFKLLADVKRLRLHKEKSYQYALDISSRNGTAQVRKMPTSTLLGDFRSAHSIIGRNVPQAVCTHNTTASKPSKPLLSSSSLVEEDWLQSQTEKLHVESRSDQHAGNAAFTMSPTLFQHRSETVTTPPAFFNEQPHSGERGQCSSSTTLPSHMPGPSSSKNGSPRHDVQVGASFPPAASFHGEGFDSPFFTFDDSTPLSQPKGTSSKSATCLRFY
jgi:hypothetical protein